jgi:hypothetical protein
VLDRRALIRIELFKVVHANHGARGPTATNHVSAFVRKWTRPLAPGSAAR